MQRLTAAFLLLFFAVTCFFQAGPPSFAKQAIEVQISHSHEDGGEHHTHTHFPTSKHESSDTSESGDTHTHTILVAAAAPFALPVKIDLVFFVEAASTVNKIEESNPPADRFLGSIFRPPILA